ncbi:hypothetical protein CEXT_364991 [Caerostris extrusa]|uniref:Uncharacterized protein n=1 Tax=Caerostris extrusa TaxID=172846 RepID=A0AAV4THK8_CAEEX|nr:hypothetical protein CEXT_364991 [Caerostris extrusa]
MLSYVKCLCHIGGRMHSPVSERTENRFFPMAGITVICFFEEKISTDRFWGDCGTEVFFDNQTARFQIFSALQYADGRFFFPVFLKGNNLCPVYKHSSGSFKKNKIEFYKIAFFNNGI